MNQTSKRFAVIGLPGSGKSTFAVKLSQILNLPVHHLDKYMFIGNQKRNREEFLAIQTALLEEESWIIEGCSISTLEMRFARADTMFYFQLPRFLCMWRVFKRLFIPNKVLAHTDDGSSKAINWKILEYIWNFERKKRAGIEELKKKYPHVHFHSFKNSQDAETYMAELKKINTRGA